MKKAIVTILLFLVFLVVFAAGSFMPPFHVQSILQNAGPAGPAGSIAPVRIFIWDGLLLAAGVFVLVLLIEVVTKRLRRAAPWTTLAFALAAVLGLAMKLGFITRGGM